MKQVKDLTDQEFHYIHELLEEFNKLGEERFMTGNHNKFRSTKQRTDIINRIADLVEIPVKGKSSNQKIRYNRWNEVIGWLEENRFKTRRYKEELKDDPNQ